MIDNEPYFVGKDIASILGYSNPPKAIRDHVDEEDKTVNEMFTVNGTQAILINESGLYSLIFSSKLPAAKPFKHWITSEVIPSIRKHGAYITALTLDNMINDPDFAIRLFTELKSEREKSKAPEAESTHKTEVITGLTEDISLAEKRQRINQIVRFKAIGKQYSARWSLLYSEFEKKYHMNIKLRYEKNKKNFKPQRKSVVDYVDRGLGMIDELYELTCKLFESDFNMLLREWSSIIVLENVVSGDF